MADEIKKIITIEVNGDQTVKSLKQEINDLRDALLNTERGSDQYEKTLNKLVEDQKKLNSVMNAGKNEVKAAAGSYNALQQEMNALKKVWKEVNDEASRNEIGARILEINTQLKDMDATIGNHQRNVGDYKNAWVDASVQMTSGFGKINDVLRTVQSTTRATTSLMRALTTATQTYNATTVATTASNKKNAQAMTQTATATAAAGKAAATAAKSMASAGKAAQAAGTAAATGAKGVNALGQAFSKVNIWLTVIVTAITLLITYWDDLVKIYDKVTGRINKNVDATKKQTEANNKLVESLELETDEMEFQARLMEARGDTQKQILEYKKQETQAILDNIDAQIAETQALINNMSAHTAWYRFWHRENKKIKELTESLKVLGDERDKISKSLRRINQDIEVEVVREQHKRTTTQKTEVEKRIALERYEGKSKLAAYEDYIKQMKKLRDSFLSEEQTVWKEYNDNLVANANGAYGQILGYVKEGHIKKSLAEEFDKVTFKEFPDNIIKQIKKIFDAVDPTKDGATITNQLRTALYNIDLKGVSKDLQKRFTEAINNLVVEEIPKNIEQKLKEAFSAGDADMVKEMVLEMFPDNQTIAEFINAYYDTTQDILKQRNAQLQKLNGDNAKKELETAKQLTDNKLALLNQEVENEKEQARIKYDVERQSWEDKKALRQAEYDADKRYTDMEIELIQQEIEEIQKKVEASKNANEEQRLDDETMLAFEQAITEKRIELIQKLRQQREQEREKQKADTADEKAELQEKYDMYTEFAQAVGDIFGSVADFWESMLEAQVKNGKKSEDQAKKEFKWIKGLQIAETTINTIAGAIGAFMKANEAYPPPYGAILGGVQAAAVTAAGIAQIARIKNTQFNGGGSSTSEAPSAPGAQIRTITTDFTPEYVTTQTGASETTNLANAVSKQNLFVSVVDINNVQNKVKVRETESTW